jgi:hypothetical protein
MTRIIQESQSPDGDMSRFEKGVWLSAGYIEVKAWTA